MKKSLCIQKHSKRDLHAELTYLLLTLAVPSGVQLTPSLSRSPEGSAAQKACLK